MAALKVEVVYALPGGEDISTVSLALGATASDAVIASGVLARHPDIDLARHKLGVFGNVVPGDARVADGDRVEIYRALAVDPKEARRRRAKRTR
jgi:putative ubiquitin-RnfH superfamily antitoxin RatB of RatAB toxin-antitoxin module